MTSLACVRLSHSESTFIKKSHWLSYIGISCETIFACCEKDPWLLFGHENGLWEIWSAALLWGLNFTNCHIESRGPMRWKENIKKVTQNNKMEMSSKIFHVSIWEFQITRRTWYFLTCYVEFINICCVCYNIKRIQCNPNMGTQLGPYQWIFQSCSKWIDLIFDWLCTEIANLDFERLVLWMDSVLISRKHCIMSWWPSG